MFEILEIVEELEAVVADAKAAEQTPAGQKLIADVETLIGKIRTQPAPAVIPSPEAAQ